MFVSSAATYHRLSTKYTHTHSHVLARARARTVRQSCALHASLTTASKRRVINYELNDDLLGRLIVDLGQRIYPVLVDRLQQDE